MATTSERIKNMDTTSSVWVTKDQREAGLKYLCEKHARQGAAQTRRNLSGLMSNGEEEKARLEAAVQQKRQRDGEVSDLMAEMQRAEEEGVAKAKASLFAATAAKQDAKPKKIAGLLVVKKQKVADGADPAPASTEKSDAAVASENKAAASASGSAQGSTEAAAAGAPAAGSSGLGGLGAYGSDSEDEEDDDDEEEG
eukprot:gb/GFBE01000873.1/.p1 GENE.gb/GFBE01000873.1/~~gb/GFBE01000873.1/.p1  ORF type:complete len:197 (+),score=62.80 gb/GFBE01000873.1/:1-591(+)